jgi:hypothetical protein
MYQHRKRGFEIAGKKIAAQLMSTDFSVSHQGITDCLASCPALVERDSPLVAFGTYVGELIVERLVVAPDLHPGVQYPEIPTPATVTV